MKKLASKLIKLKYNGFTLCEEYWMNNFLLLLCLSYITLNANVITINSNISLLNNYKFETPHSLPIQIPNKTKLVIVAFEKATGTTVNEYLNSKTKYYLQNNHSVYIADIHEMPSIITNMFALPKMKKYKHLINSVITLR